MSDARLRDAERAYRLSGSPDDERALLHEHARRNWSALTREKLEALACLDVPEAVEVLRAEERCWLCLLPLKGPRVYGGFGRLIANGAHVQLHKSGLGWDCMRMAVEGVTSAPVLIRKDLLCGEPSVRAALARTRYEFRSSLKKVAKRKTIAVHALEAFVVSPSEATGAAAVAAVEAAKWHSLDTAMAAVRLMLPGMALPDRLRWGNSQWIAQAHATGGGMPVEWLASDVVPWILGRDPAADRVRSRMPVEAAP